MPDPATVKPQGTPSANPCACCREKPHEGMPDRDLNAYVCRECHKFLRQAAVILHKAGFAKPATTP